MTDVAIDLSHSALWPTSQGALHRELAWVSLVPELSASAQDLSGRLRVIGQPWTAADLTNVRLLLLPAAGRLGDRPFTEEEARLLAVFIANGGAVLAFGDGDRRPLQREPFPCLPAAKVDLAPDLLATPRTDLTHVLTFDVSGQGVPGHPVTDGIGQLFVRRSRPILAGPEVEVLVRRDDHVLAVAGVAGHGRVLVVSNAEMFAPPFLGRADNERFLRNALAWLTTGSTPGPIGDVSAAAGGPPAADPDLTHQSGPHFLDVSRYEGDLIRLAHVPAPDLDRDPDGFLAEAELRFHELPRELRAHVATFRRNPNDYGVLLVRGLPVDERLPPTPVDAHARPDKDGRCSELWLAAFASALGSPFAYLQEQSGALYQNVVPTPGNADKLSSESSSILLGFHTEMGFHPYQPDYVLLFCLRSDHERVARTITASARLALPHLSPTERALLFEPLFCPGIDYSFGSPNGKRGNGPTLPVFYGDPYDPFMNVDADLGVGVTAEAEAALAALRAACNRVARWVTLCPGDLLIIDNRRAAHARSAFTARYDGEDRWLQRMCVVRDLAPSATDRRDNERIIETTFAF